MTPPKKRDKVKVKKVKHEHDFEIEQCQFCGHCCEMCLKCWKGRCDAETKNGKPMPLTKVY